jgi:hypothetical protein
MVDVLETGCKGSSNMLSMNGIIAEEILFVKLSLL